MPVRIDTSQWAADVIDGYEKSHAEFQRIIQPPACRSGPCQPTSSPTRMADTWHLNARGAQPFSRWLGERLAEAVDKGEIVRPRRAPGRRRSPRMPIVSFDSRIRPARPGRLPRAARARASLLPLASYAFYAVESRRSSRCPSPSPTSRSPTARDDGAPQGPADRRSR
jgi:hypothetical protein